MDYHPLSSFPHGLKSNFGRPVIHEGLVQIDRGGIQASIDSPGMGPDVMVFTVNFKEFKHPFPKNVTGE